MVTDKLIDSSWESIEVKEFEEESILQPKYQCELCGAAISEKWSDITGNCSNCTNEINEVGGYLDRIYAVTIYFSEADDHTTSEQLAPPKDGTYAKKKARMLQWGIENFDELNEVDLLVSPPSGEEGKYNHMVDTGERLSKFVDIPFRNVTDGDYDPQKEMEDAQSRKKNVRDEITCPANLQDTERVLIIDDIVATCTTLSDTARVLLESGVDKVEGLSASRSMDFRGLKDARAMEEK